MFLSFVREEAVHGNLFIFACVGSVLYDFNHLICYEAGHPYRIAQFLRNISLLFWKKQASWSYSS